MLNNRSVSFNSRTKYWVYCGYFVTLGIFGIGYFVLSLEKKAFLLAVVKVKLYYKPFCSVLGLLGFFVLYLEKITHGSCLLSPHTTLKKDFTRSEHFMCKV